MFKTFGKKPSGKRLERIKASPNYSKTGFENLSPTPMMMENSNMLKMTWKFFNKPKNTQPSAAIPSVKTDLKNITGEKPVIVWFGHSSYLIHINGKHILVDPVFGGYASPFNFGVKSFNGTDIYSVDDLPPVDVLLLTHDHFDHLDIRTIAKLKGKVKTICTSLGVGSHLEYWGFEERQITELYWWETAIIAEGIKLTAAPARHFSGRTFDRNKTLWSSFILEAGGYKIYIGADSGYDTHFSTIGQKYGPFDLAILETGQYNTQWPLIHMMPEQAVQASIDLNAKWMLPVHWGKFALAFHPWQEPVERVLAEAGKLNVKVTTPMIGEKLVLDEAYPQNTWWRSI